MSSSKEGENNGKWGTIFMGPGNANERTLSQVEGSRTLDWDDDTREEYLSRVRERATERAAQIIAEARAEGEAIKAQAQQDGYNAGLAQAQQELEQFQQTMSDSVSGVLGAIQGQCSNIFTQWRQDLVMMMRVALQRVLGIEIDESRAAILESLFVQSIGLLDNQRKLIIKVNPEDEAAVADIIQTTQQRFPGLEAWSVHGDPNVGPGGMVVESQDGMVDNTLESRLAIVDQVLSQVVIPEDGI